MTRAITRSLLLAIALATTAGTSCTDRPVEKEVSEEQKRITCGQVCSRETACEGADEDVCFDDCLDYERMWEWGCEDLAIERAACLADFSCPDYVSLEPGGDGPCEPIHGKVLDCYKENFRE